LPMRKFPPYRRYSTQNVDGSVYVAVDNQTAGTAGMNTDRQILTDDQPPLGTFLRRASGIHFDVSTTGAFSLVAQLVSKLGPRCIQNAFRKFASGKPCAQFFDGNQIEGIDESPAQLVCEVRSGVGNLGVNLLYLA